MAKWGDIALWVGPTPNENPNGMGLVMGLVLHIQQGNQAGSLAWCKNPASQVSAHFFAPKSGQLVQLVDTGDKAWAQAAGNGDWISVECEGYSGQSLTDSQLQACGQLMARIHQVYGVPLQITDDPDHGAGLGWHGMGGDAWGGHPDCPGDPVKSQRYDILARAQALIGTPPPVGKVPPTPSGGAPAWPGRDFQYIPGDPMTNGPDVLAWQRRMQARGWGITADGVYGPRSASVCLAFQRDSTTHGWLLAEDSIVGPRTWVASWERPVS